MKCIRRVEYAELVLELKWTGGWYYPSKLFHPQSIRRGVDRYEVVQIPHGGGVRYNGQSYLFWIQPKVDFSPAFFFASFLVQLDRHFRSTSSKNS